MDRAVPPLTASRSSPEGEPACLPISSFFPGMFRQSALFVPCAVVQPPARFSRRPPDSGQVIFQLDYDFFIYTLNGPCSSPPHRFAELPRGGACLLADFLIFPGYVSSVSPVCALCGSTTPSPLRSPPPGLGGRGFFDLNEYFKLACVKFPI